MDTKLIAIAVVVVLLILIGAYYYFIYTGHWSVTPSSTWMVATVSGTTGTATSAAAPSAMLQTYRYVSSGLYTSNDSKYVLVVVSTTLAYVVTVASSSTAAATATAIAGYSLADYTTNVVNAGSPLAPPAGVHVSIFPVPTK